MLPGDVSGAVAVAPFGPFHVTSPRPLSIIG